MVRCREPRQRECCQRGGPSLCAFAASRLLRPHGAYPLNEQGLGFDHTRNLHRCPRHNRPSVRRAERVVSICCPRCMLTWSVPWGV